MSPEGNILLYHEGSKSPLTEMWPDEKYAQIMQTRVNSIVERIMAGSMPPPLSNGLNIFSWKSGMPLNICYPPKVLADSLAQSYQTWINNLKNAAASHELIKSYTFTFTPRDEAYVRFFESTDVVFTGTVIFTYLTAVSRYSPHGSD